MKKFRKLIPALALLLVSAVLMSTASYAWFSMNNKVTVTGMEVTTKVGSNLLIKNDTLGSTQKIADADFVTSDTDNVSGLLEPVSTKDGKAFFYTLNAKTTGDAVADDYVAYNAAEVPTSGELTTFASEYGANNAIGYVDYVFQLKAVNAATAAKDIKITKLNLTYDGAKDASKAHRVAVFVEDITSGTVTAGSGSLRGIYSVSGAANQSDANNHNYAVGAAATAPSQLTNDYNNVSVVANVAANSTKYYKVVVRLYLEGEDTTCKNDTFAALTSAWKLDLELAIDTESTTNTAVSAITKYTSFTSVNNSTKYYCDGTNVYTEIGGTAVTSSGLNNATVEAELETAFGVSIG